MPAAPKRPRRPRPRLGKLAYEPPTRPFSQAAAQAWFLDAAARVQPQILRDLTDEPLRVYKEVMWYRLEAAKDLDPWDAVDFVDAWATWDAFLRELGDYVRQAHEDIDLRPLKESIVRWAARWNMGGVDWVKATALRTLAVWAVLPDASLEWRHGETPVPSDWRLGPEHVRRARLPKQMPVGDVITREERRLKLAVDGWDPRFETRDQAARRLRQTFEKRLAAHLAAMEQRVAEAGLVPTPTKRGADEHWAWLAQRVVLGWTYEQIAEEAGNQRPASLAVESVHEAVAKAASLAGLPLPKGKPGRPPKAPSDRKR